MAPETLSQLASEALGGAARQMRSPKSQLDRATLRREQLLADLVSRTLPSLSQQLAPIHTALQEHNNENSNNSDGDDDDDDVTQDTRAATLCGNLCQALQAVLTVVQDHTHTLSQCLTDTHTDHTTTATDVSRVLDQQTNNTQSLAQLTTLTEPVSSLGAHTVLEAAAATQQQQYNHEQQQGTGGGSFSFALLPEAARQLSVGDQPFPLRPAATTAAAAAEQPDWQAAAAAAAAAAVSAGSGGQLALQGQVSAFLAAVANALKNVSAVTIQHGVTSLPDDAGPQQLLTQVQSLSNTLTALGLETVASRAAVTSVSACVRAKCLTLGAEYEVYERLLPSVKWLLETVYLPFVLAVVCAHKGDKTHGADSTHSTQAEKKAAEVWRRQLYHVCHEAVCEIRCDQIFDLFGEYPDEAQLVQDLAECLRHTNMRTHFINSTRAALSRRLLLPGAPADVIVNVYASLIRAMSEIDPTGTLLPSVVGPVRAYLRTRPDAVRCIIERIAHTPGLRAIARAEGAINLLQADEATDKQKSLLLQEDDETRNASLDNTTKKAHPDAHTDDTVRSLLEALNTHDTTQTDTDTLTALPTGLNTNSSNADSNTDKGVVQLLVEVFKSKEHFLHEYRSCLGVQLLTGSLDPGTYARAFHAVELLKNRFGEKPLRECEVMLRDVFNTKSINRGCHEILSAEYAQCLQECEDRRQKSDKRRQALNLLRPMLHAALQQQQQAHALRMQQHQQQQGYAHMAMRQQQGMMSQGGLGAHNRVYGAAGGVGLGSGSGVGVGRGGFGSGQSPSRLLPHQQLAQQQQQPLLRPLPGQPPVAGGQLVPLPALPQGVSFSPQQQPQHAQHVASPHAARRAGQTPPSRRLRLDAMSAASGGALPATGGSSGPANGGRGGGRGAAGAARGTTGSYARGPAAGPHTQPHMGSDVGSFGAWGTAPAPSAVHSSGLPHTGAAHMDTSMTPGTVYGMGASGASASARMGGLGMAVSESPSTPPDQLQSPNHQPLVSPGPGHPINPTQARTPQTMGGGAAGAFYRQSPQQPAGRHGQQQQPQQQRTPVAFGSGAAARAAAAGSARTPAGAGPAARGGARTPAASTGGRSGRYTNDTYTLGSVSVGSGLFGTPASGSDVSPGPHTHMMTTPTQPAHTHDTTTNTATISDLLSALDMPYNQHLATPAGIRKLIKRLETAEAESQGCECDVSEDCGCEAPPSWLTATAVSHLFWPLLGGWGDEQNKAPRGESEIEARITLPDTVVKAQERFSKAYHKYKEPRHLKWKPHLGRVELEVCVGDVCVTAYVSPVLATLLMAFQPATAPATPPTTPPTTPPHTPRTSHKQPRRHTGDTPTRDRRGTSDRDSPDHSPTRRHNTHNTHGNNDRPHDEGVKEGGVETEGERVWLTAQQISDKVGLPVSLVRCRLLFWLEQGILVEQQLPSGGTQYAPALSLDKSLHGEVISDAMYTDELSLSAAEGATQGGDIEALSVFEPYVHNILNGMGAMALDRLHTMMKRVVVSPKFEASVDQFAAFLQLLVRQGKITLSAAGQYARVR